MKLTQSMAYFLCLLWNAPRGHKVSRNKNRTNDIRALDELAKHGLLQRTICEEHPNCLIYTKL